MPKKKSKTEKKDIGKKDKILEEIATKLKSIKDKELISDRDPKEENINEEIDSSDIDLEDLEFSQFMQTSEPSGNRAPVLERIAGSQPSPVFVGGMPQTPFAVQGEEEKTDEFKYVPGHTGNDEPKYLASDSRISLEPTPIDLMKVGRRQAELVPQVDQEAFSMHSESHLNIESPTIERTWGAEQIDIERAGRRDPFEEDDTKYKNYKPKLPK